MEYGSSPADPPLALVGRDAAMRALAGALDATTEGSRWAFVEGPPGSGRTRLLEEVAALAEARGAEVRRLRGDENARALRRPPDLETTAGSDGGTVVVCVDELQWLDAPALERLDALRGARRALLLVGAVRAGPAPAAAVLLDALRAEPSATTVELPRLRPEEARTLLEAAGARGDAALARRCAELCAGNPLLLTVLGRHLSTVRPAPTARTVESLAEPLLKRVARYWAGQLARCGPEAEPLIDAALVLGDGTPLWLAAELADARPAAAAAAADDLVRIGVLSRADPLAFAVPLARAALDGRTNGARRQQLRREAARLLGRTADGLDAAAAHLLAVPPCGEPWSAELLREAAAAATEEGRNDVAAARLERALEEPVASELRAALLVELGEARDRAGLEGAETAYRHALRVAPEALHARIHLRLGRSRFGLGDYGGAVQAFDRGLEGIDEDDPIGVELVAGYVAAARFDGTLEGEAQRRLAPLLDRTEGARSPAERTLLAEIALERAIRGAPREQVLQLARRAWDAGRLLDGADRHGIVLSEVAAVFTWSDAFDESEGVLSVALERAERDGEALASATAHYLRAWPRYYRGALAEAEADVHAALGGTGWEMYEPSARAVLGHVLIECGRHDEARDALSLGDEEPWRQTPPYAMLLEVRARLAVLGGDLDTAHEALAAAGKVFDAMGSRHPFCPWRSRLGIVVARRGDLEGGRGFVEEELEQARSVGVPRPLGLALHARALIEELAGGDGLADLRAGAEALEACGARVDHAYALVDLGRLTAAGGRRDEARRVLHEALALATTLGATGIAERAAHALRASGGRPRLAALGNPGGLTESELRVARLVAHGRTNREIAEELVVTTHTVRFHLANAYRKLRVSGREEVAGALRALGDDAAP